MALSPFLCGGRALFAVLCAVRSLIHILNIVDSECFGLAHPHGKYPLFKLALCLPARHLIPYYAEIFLASSLSHRRERGSAVLGGGSLPRFTVGHGLPLPRNFIRVSAGPHRKPEPGAACFHLRCRGNLDPAAIPEMFCFSENPSAALVPAQTQKRLSRGPPNVSCGLASTTGEIRTCTLASKDVLRLLASLCATLLIA